MIIAEQKPVNEILKNIPENSRLLIVGCDTCVTVCLAGGEKEVAVLSSVISMSDKKMKSIEGTSIERQCDKEFLSEIKDRVSECDIILSMACGVGVQMMSDYYNGKIVLPALNTLFMGSNEETGYWLERCLGCGDCSLDITGGICPKTRCSKGLMNGPCGGSEGGKCEVDPENLDCGWNLIYNRLKELNRLDTMAAIQPPRDWSKSHDGGPRRIIREDLLL
ncbi:MAG: methylenetetrahydrofolate reductase C-terminal domain-containing protein [Spirochaetales bacterium]|nr:methylenetetrahydrofolate reductase C-terminal domain-containing protein [Spirochaetales bacterium]